MRILFAMITFILCSCTNIEQGNCSVHTNEPLHQIDQNNPRPVADPLFYDYRVTAHSSLWKNCPNSLYVQSKKGKELPIQYCLKCTDVLVQKIADYDKKKVCRLHHTKFKTYTLYKRKRLQISPSDVLSDLSNQSPNSRPFDYNYYYEGDKEDYHEMKWDLCEYCENAYSRARGDLWEEGQRQSIIEDISLDVEKIKEQLQKDK